MKSNSPEFSAGVKMHKKRVVPTMQSWDEVQPGSLMLNCNVPETKYFIIANEGRFDSDDDVYRKLTVIDLNTKKIEKIMKADRYSTYDYIVIASSAGGCPAWIRYGK